MDGQAESTSGKPVTPPINKPKVSIVTRRMKIKKRWYVLTGVIILLVILSLPEIYHTNAGVSESIGSVRDGKLKNGWLLPHEGPNFHYFSGFSYYILNNGYVHSSVYHTVMAAYKTCETTSPGTTYRLMECSGKHGGGMLFHWTHQNGLSVDFMVPKKRGATKTILSNYAGLAHYLLKFSPNGQFQLSPKTEIDFEAMALHVLALDDAARQNGLSIRKILFHTDLHDELFSTPSGQLLAQRDVRFISQLSDLVNRFHDDHYHVDFQLIADGE